MNNDVKVIDDYNFILKKNPNNMQIEKPCQAEHVKNILADEITKNQKYYLYRERAFMIDKYGKSLFNLNKEYEAKFLIPSNFLERHSLSPEVREKMVDWMVEVFSVNKSEPGTLELAVHIMDAYILNTKRVLKNSDIHLIGLCSIYLASKVEEKVPLRLTHIVNNLGKNTFSKDEIIEMERDIVKTIEFDFFTAGSYDYLMVFFYDLKVNNYRRLNQLGGKDVVDKFYDTVILDSERNKRLAKCIDVIDIEEMQTRYKRLWWNDAVTLVIMEKILGVTHFSEAVFSQFINLTTNKLLEIIDYGIKEYQVRNKLNKLESDFN